MYNLTSTANANEFDLSATGLNAKSHQLSQLLAEWYRFQGSNQHKYLCFPLDYPYQARPRLENLQLSDRNRTQYVIECCKISGNFCVLLADLQLVWTTTFDDPVSESEKLELSYVGTSDGERLGWSIPISESSLLEDEFNGRDPDQRTASENYEDEPLEIEEIFKDAVR